MKGKIALSFLCLSLFFSSAVSASSSSNIEYNKLTEEEQQQLDERSAIVRSYFLKIEEAKGKVQKLEDMVHNSLSDDNGTNNINIQVLNTQLLNAKQELTSITDSYADYGLEKIEGEKESQIEPFASDASDYKNTEMTLYYDSEVKKYVINGSGEFTTTDWKKDNSVTSYVSDGWKDVGGLDGFSIYSLHKDINVYNPEFYTLHYSDPTINTNWTYAASQYPDSRGYAWGYQDKTKLKGALTAFATWEDYNNWRQVGWFYFTFVGGVPTGQTISFSEKFGHTWNSTTINSISYPFGFGWSTNSNKWDKGTSYSYKF